MSIHGITAATTTTHESASSICTNQKPKSVKATIFAELNPPSRPARSNSAASAAATTVRPTSPRTVARGRSSQGTRKVAGNSRAATSRTSHRSATSGR
jgi:hypothetical protein